MIRIVFAACLLTASPALAQQQPPSALDRISTAYGQCVGGIEQRVDEITNLQKQLAAAQARIKELEPQADPKKKN